MTRGFSETKPKRSESMRLLRNGPYMLLEEQETFSFTPDVWEQWWLGRTTDEHAQRLLVCEVCVPGSSTARTAIIRPAIARFTQISTHPQMPTLLNVLSEQEHTFFVFAWPGEENLPGILHRLKRPLTLQETMPGCWQLLHLLRWLASQQPAITHGTICPEHIHLTREGHWILSHCSILLTTEAVAAHSPSWSRRTSLGEREGKREKDLPALMAAILFALTGQQHASVRTQLEQLTQQYPDVAQVVTTLLSKAFHPVASLRATRPEELLPLVDHLMQRYNPASQRPSEQPGQAAREAETSAVPVMPLSSPAAAFVSVQSTTPLSLPSERRGMLPHPEELPPLPPGQDGWAACFWTCQFLLCLACLFLLAS